MNMPKKVYENDDGYVMEWPDGDKRFTAFEFRVKPKRTSGILLADYYHGGYPTLEEARANICQKKK